MMRRVQSSVRHALAALLASVVLLGLPAAASAEQRPPGQLAFANGFPADPRFLPIGVWLQSPRNAAAYGAVGINTYVGLWQAPTDAELAHLEAHGLYAVVEPTPGTLRLGNARVIRAWLQTDEPDNAQADGRGGYGDCILPDEVVRRYGEMRRLDATRPVFLNFGQAVANPRWFGRGERCSMIAPENYYRPASRGADIVSFDIYPAAEERQGHVMGRLELVGKGVANLKRWAQPGQPVWAAIETTHINHPTRRPLPHEVRAEVWMALVHGANGIFYFAHEWQPTFREDAVFRYPDTLREISRINAQVRELAPVLNAQTVSGRIKVESAAEIAVLVKRHGDAHYLFAVNMENRPAKARLALTGIDATHAILLGEERLFKIEGGAIAEQFEAYGVRLYKLPDRQ
jgi:hypothetical protein